MDGARYGEQYGDQLEESNVDPNLDDDMVEIKHGSPLRKCRMEELIRMKRDVRKGGISGFQIFQRMKSLYGRCF